MSAEVILTLLIVGSLGLAGWFWRKQQATLVKLEEKRIREELLKALVEQSPRTEEARKAYEEAYRRAITERNNYTPITGLSGGGDDPDSAS